MYQDTALKILEIQKYIRKKYCKLFERHSL